MRGWLDDLRDKAWIATALMGALAAAFASFHLALPTALAAMAAGAVMMWKSEEPEEDEALAVAVASVCAPEPEGAPIAALKPAA